MDMVDKDMDNEINDNNNNIRMCIRIRRPLWGCIRMPFRISQPLIKFQRRNWRSRQQQWRQRQWSLGQQRQRQLVHEWVRHAKWPWYNMYTSEAGGSRPWIHVYYQPYNFRLCTGVSLHNSTILQSKVGGACHPNKEACLNKTRHSMKSRFNITPASFRLFVPVPSDVCNIELYQFM